VEEIRDRETFGKMMEKMSNTEKIDVEHAKIELRPQSDRDFNFIGINSKIKLPNP